MRDTTKQDTAHHVYLATQLQDHGSECNPNSWGCGEDVMEEWVTLLDFCFFTYSQQWPFVRQTELDRIILLR